MESDGLHKQWKRIGIGLLIILLVILGGILWWQLQSPEQAVREILSYRMGGRMDIIR